jgi:hypothetical protein
MISEFEGTDSINRGAGGHRVKDGDNRKFIAAAVRASRQTF